MIRAGILRYFRLPLRRRSTIHERVEDEIRLHLELRIEQLVGRGLSRSEARREALRRFGSLRAARRRLRHTARRKEGFMSVRETMDGIGQDVRYVLRTLRQEPGFTAMIVLTLALGIGANAAMFGILDRLLLRGPEHIVQSDRVQRVYVTSTGGGGPERTYASMGYVMYASLRDQGRSFERVAAYATNEYTLGRGEGSEQVQVGMATWDYFPLLGVPAQRGHFFNEVEDRPLAGQRVAVISHELWRRRFQSADDVIGRTIEIGGESFTVIGIAPRGFTGARLTPVDVWAPMAALTRTTADWPTTWRAQWLNVVVRLKPGVAPEAANADASRVLRAVYPTDQTNLRNATLSVRPLYYSNRGVQPPEVVVARWLIGVSAIVLLIACANVANLLLARAVRRRREVAVRVVLGITRTRLVRLLLTESLLLSGLGALAGLAVAHWGGNAMRVLLLPNVHWTHAPINARVLGFSILAAFGAGLLIGLVPILQAASSDLASALKSGTREGGGRRSPTRTALTVAQAALSVVLLVGAGLFVKSLWNVRHLDLGLEPELVLHVSAGWPASRSDEERTSRPQAVNQFWDRALERVRSMPEVAVATTSVGTPFNSSFGVFLRVPGHDSIPRMPGGGPYIAAVQSGYLETLGIRLLRGRDFTSADGARSERVVIVNDLMAATLWPKEDPIGKCLVIGADTIPCARVVGMVAEARRFDLREEHAMQYYIPFGQEIGMGGRDLLVRPRGDPEALIERLRRELQHLGPDVLYFNIATLQESLDPQIRPWRLGASMFAIFGALALLIAAVGLYSVIAYLVSQRTQELGVRMALGARAADILSLILRQGLGMTLLGIALGIIIAFSSGRFIRNLLFETSPRDPLVFGVVTITLLLAASLALVLPARRAMRVDPAEALRTE